MAWGMSPGAAATLNRALDLLRAREPAQAEAELSACAELEREPELLNTLGNALVAQGRAGEAEAPYRRALAIEPSFSKSLNNLGNLLRDRGALGEATALYRRALAIDPGSHRAHANLGATLLLSGDLEQAVSSFEQSFALGGDLPLSRTRHQEGLRRLLAERSVWRQPEVVFAQACADLGLTLTELTAPALEPRELGRERVVWTCPVGADEAAARALLGRAEELGLTACRLIPGLLALVPLAIAPPTSLPPLVYTLSAATTAQLLEAERMVPALRPPLAKPAGRSPLEHAVEHVRWALTGRGPLSVKASEIAAALAALEPLAADEIEIGLAYARTACEWGDFGRARRALDAALARLDRRGAYLEQVALAPLSRFDGIELPPGEELGVAEGLILVALEELPNPALALEESRVRLARLAQLRFGDARMDQRRAWLGALH